ncbi:MAG: diguanylate cyclase [Acholeplasmataceae bacterium]
MDMLNRLIELFRHFHEGIYIVDRNRKILYFNPVAEQISGYSKDEVVGKYCNDNILNHIDEDGTRLCIIGCPLKASMDQDEVNQGDIYLHHKNGHRVKIAVRTIPFKDHGSVVYGVEVFRDLTQNESYEKRLNEEKIKTFIDPLTKCYNRRYLDLLIQGEIEIFQGHSHGVLFLDIDEFKMINDTYGHDFGDKVLTNLTQTIQLNINTDDIAIRYGGEEFIVFLKDVSKELIIKKAENLRMLIEGSFIKTADENIVVTVSVGASLFKKHEEITAAIITADKAHYIVKQNGKNGVHFL